MPIEPRLISALRAQFTARDASLRAGARRIGWKMGMGDTERMGGPVIGHLTSATLLSHGDTYRGGSGDLHADAEVALELGEDGEIARYAAALEIVDLHDNDAPAADIVAANVFHRAVAFGPFGRDFSPGAVRVVVNGAVRGSATSEASFDDRVARAAELLEAMGEGLMAGDRIITGSVVQVPVAAGDALVADFGSLGAVQLFLAP